MLKRGQITIFLVIGIVILLLAALFFYIFGQIKEAPLEVEAKEAQKIPGVRGTLQSYVENCIQETLDPAIYLLAIQGGVIYPEDDGKILLTDYELITSDVTIKDASVQAEVQLPTKIILPNNDSLEVETFTAEIQSSLGKTIKTVEELGFPDLNPSQLLALPYQPIIFPYDEAVTIYSFTEKSGEAPLTFMFAIRNDFPDNQAPLLHFIADR